MNETLRDLLSMHWWITVVIASLLLNVAASYMRDALDKLIPRASSWLGRWTDSRIADFEAEIDRAAGDLGVATYFAASQASYHIAALHGYILGGGCIFAGAMLGPGSYSSAVWSSLLTWTGWLFTMFGAADFGRARRCRQVLDGARSKWAQKSAAPISPPLR